MRASMRAGPMCTPLLRTPDPAEGDAGPSRSPLVAVAGHARGLALQLVDQLGGVGLAEAFRDLTPAVARQRAEVGHLGRRRRLIAGSPVLRILGGARLVGAHDPPLP